MNKSFSLQNMPEQLMKIAEMANLDDWIKQWIN
jgi:ABC-type transporter Mla MlaB component